MHSTSSFSVWVQCDVIVDEVIHRITFHTNDKNLELKQETPFYNLCFLGYFYWKENMSTKEERSSTSPLRTLERPLSMLLCGPSCQAGALNHTFSSVILPSCFIDIPSKRYHHWNRHLVPWNQAHTCTWDEFFFILYYGKIISVTVHGTYIKLDICGTHPEMVLVSNHALRNTRTEKRTL